MASKKGEEKGFDKLGILSDVTSMFSKVFKNKTMKVLSFTTKALDFVSKRIEKELKKVKRALTQLSLLAMAALFLMIGGTMYLEKIFPSLSNGLNFVVVGVGFLFILLVYSAINRD